MARYLHILADFDLELQHIPGSTNKADALSWWPDHDNRSQNNEEIVTLPNSLFMRALSIGIEEKQIQEWQQVDKDLFKEWKWVHQCKEEDGALYWKVLWLWPMEEKFTEIFYNDTTMGQLQDTRACGKPGKCCNKIIGGQQWKLLSKNMWQVAPSANKTKWSHSGINHCYSPSILKKKPLPFVTMLVNFVVKLLTSRGSDSILTIMDQGCIKVIILIPCQEDMGAEVVTELFKEQVFSYTRILTRLILDCNARFTSYWIKELCRALRIDQNISTAYHPQTNGQSERTNQTMEGLLHIFCNHQVDNWAEWLSLVQYIINSWPSSTVKKAPYELWMGHIPQAHQRTKDLKVPDLVTRQRTLKTVREEAALAMQHAQESWIKPTNYSASKNWSNVLYFCVI